MIGKPIATLFTAIATIALPSISHATTVAYWNFDEGTPGQYFSENPADDLSGNGHAMSGFDTTYGPAYSSVGSSPSGSGLSLDTVTGGRDGYTTTAGSNTWAPAQWTIEASVALDNVGGFLTVIGRDGSSFGGPLSNFYLQKFAASNGGLGSWRADFSTVGGQRVTMDTLFTPVAGTWYQLAVTSDGTTARFFVNDLSGSAGYAQVGSTALTGDAAANALASNGANWTFGRGWYNGGFVDGIDGRIDEVRFSDTALTPAQFIVVPEPSTLLIGSLGLFGLLRRRRS
jgi:hypothetical protein